MGMRALAWGGLSEDVQTDNLSLGAAALQYSVKRRKTKGAVFLVHSFMVASSSCCGKSEHRASGGFVDTKECLLPAPITLRVARNCSSYCSGYTVDLGHREPRCMAISIHTSAGCHSSLTL